MKDQDKKKEELISEVAELQQRIAELEALEAERKRAEKALRESEEKYRRLVERPNDGITIIQDGIVRMERFASETFPRSITEIGKDLWSLKADPTQLHQVLLNLCLDAKDAMPGGGSLNLSTENFSVDESYAKMHPEAKVGPYLVFSVEDTRSGIPPDLLPKIFDPFFTTKERGQGTGLGLATACAILKGHQGFVEVSSELGKGTRFSIYLPASPPAKVERGKEEQRPLPSGKEEVILVVDDEASICETAQAVLESYGYSVLSPADGSEAVALYAQHGKEIQVVITDMAMPVMDGWISHHPGPAEDGPLG